MLEIIVTSSIQVTVVIVAVLAGCAWATWLERKVLAHMQQRYGPLWTGPYGLLQPIADGLKLMFKEDLVPDTVERSIYALAPIVAFIPALLTFAVIPFSPDFTVFGYEFKGVISDLNIGILWVFAITSLGVYGLILAGWSSASKYSLLGGLRASAQMISYEISYGLSIVGVILIANTLSMTELVAQQDSQSVWFFENWFVWKQPFGFLLYITCAIAETNRTPFDLPEAESELVGGYNTEYSSLRFALFFIGEYANMLGVACVATTLFFGGWHGPAFLSFIPPVIWFLVKVFVFMFCYIWLRATFPRFRYDQLMRFGWLVLFPLAILNTMITGLIVLL
ncbi:MAG TPA: NADH-quinone oxidoreductase subunit NuoH [Acidobacteriota bacterium]|nr:NADH-quinone oxidoreductase subunit NuoH [Acidobacteriota bacterium]